MGISEVKKELGKFDKEYFDFFVNPDENELHKKYHDKIFDAFYPKRGFDLKLKDAKQAIADFKKLEPSTELLADIMLYYAECGVKYTNDFGDIDEQFYTSIEKMYLKALTLMQKEDLLDKFKVRALKIVKDTDGIGWGFHDYLRDVQYDFYSGNMDEEK